ncbi:hypothetical protein MNBD_GAMMA04-1829 [hydrothermal vent metagenome]|uniref:Uncharacterized protein n=1 Tax=hydrothermal vent metagenome TaxID=652676 RepID=A0A3B0WHD0_9ZZZZ
MLRVVVHIYKAVSRLASFPVGGDIKALKNHKYDYRLRVGDYQVIEQGGKPVFAVLPYDVFVEIGSLGSPNIQ